VHLMQEDCNTMLRELLSILEAGEEGTEHSEELEKLRAELLQAREDAKSKDAEVAEFKQQLIQSSNALSGVADEETNGQSAPARALNLNLQRAKELVNMTIENVAKEHLTNHTSVISGATQGTNTTVGLSFDDMTAKVTGVMVGGPAFNSKKINKDDVIVKIDGQQVQGNQVLDLLRGSDQPGSVVEITLKRTSVSAFMIWNAASAAA
jgi:C-terminal processing protease CtpA/Prc